jgi:hypothetical protein
MKQFGMLVPSVVLLSTSGNSLDKPAGGETQRRDRANASCVAASS